MTARLLHLGRGGAPTHHPLTTAHLSTTHHNQLTIQTPSTAAAAVTNYCHHLRTTRKGPNDVSCVIWALGEFFFIYSCFLLYTNDFYRSYLGYTCKNDNNGPKVSIFLKNHSCFFIILTMFNRFLGLDTRMRINTPPQQDTDTSP